MVIIPHDKYNLCLVPILKDTAVSPSAANSLPPFHIAGRTVYVDENLSGATLTKVPVIMNEIRIERFVLRAQGTSFYN